ALITGEIHVAITPMATSLPHVAAGTVRALAVAGAKRSAALPDVPTVAESGLLGFESSSWQGWFVPTNTPREIVGVIQQRANAALSAPDVLERLRVTGNEAVRRVRTALQGRPREICQDRQGSPYSCAGLNLSRKSELFAAVCYRFATKCL